MAIGFFAKLADIAKKVGKGISTGAKKALQVTKKVYETAKPIADVVVPTLGAVDPRLKQVSDTYEQYAPVADMLLGSR